MANEFLLNRRDVLRGLGGLALTGLGGIPLACGPSEPGEPSTGSISADLGVSVIAAVPNRVLPLPAEVYAYAQNSVAAGDTIQLRVSSPLPYQFSVVRLGWEIRSASKDWTVFTGPGAAPTVQVIRPGSYIHVERAVASTAALPQLTLECWVRSVHIGWQGLITQYTYGGSCGFGLFIDGDGKAACYFGNGGAFDASHLRSGTTVIGLNTWNHVVAVFANGSIQLYVNGQSQVVATGTLATATPGTSPLRIGAYGDTSGTTGFLNGDIAMPVIYSRALTLAEIQGRATMNPVSPPGGGSIEGCWPLSEEKGPVVTDVSTSGRDGVVVNHGTWMIGGPRFNASQVPQPYNPDTDTSRGHGLRLSSSDIYDCAWQVTDSHQIPSDLPPGIYAGRLLFNAGHYDVPFVVRRAASRPPAPLVVLCPTNTWRAYSVPFGLFGLYQPHPTGQAPYYTGINMPWGPELVTRNDLVFPTQAFLVWLEQNGYDFDVLSDYDLHTAPSVLGQYRAAVISGHSEYWSSEMYDGVKNYVAAGGKLISASGNTMFWRMSFNTDVIECRKSAPNQGSLRAELGEAYHEHDGHFRGGLMREAGYPAWKVIGLESTGYDGDGAPYLVTHRPNSSSVHDFFLSPESAGVMTNSPLGGAFAVYGEWEATMVHIPGAPSPPSDYKPEILARCTRTAQRWDYQTNWVPAGDGSIKTLGVISEMIDWPHPGGGRVFAAGSIGIGEALLADRSLAVTFRNALHHMNVVFRLNVSAIGNDGHLVNKSFDGTSWDANWNDMGISFEAPPAGVMWAPGTLAVAAITQAGTLYYNYFQGGSWSGLSSFGDGFQGQPVAVAWGRNQLTLFARSGNDLRQRVWDGATWSAWQDVGGGVASDVTAVAWEGNRLSVAALGDSGNLLYKCYTGGGSPSQMNWQDLGGSFAQAPTLFAWNGTFVSVFAVDATGRVLYKTWNGSEWSPSWQDIGVGPVASRVAIAAWGPSQFTVFGIGPDGRIKNKWFDGTTWGPDAASWSDNLGGTFGGNPTAATFRGSSIELMAVASDGHLRHAVWNGSAWSPWADLEGDLRGSPTVFRWV